MTTNALGFVFPGQGSQSIGMLADIADQFSEVLQTFADASDILGYDLWRLVQEGPVEELDKTVHTQPALLAASYAIWRILSARHFMKPMMLAGHSLGEYTALVCTNALSFHDAIKLVAARGQFMQEAVSKEEGAMAALIGLDEASVAAICKQAITHAHDVLAPANFNSIGQIVIAGHKKPVEKAILLAKEQGAKLAIFIPVSVPSHCKLMEPAARRLATLLESIPLQTPTIPIVNNVDVAIYDSASSIRNGLTRQLYLPVRWVETIEYFVKAGVTKIIECGPGKVLTGLNKRIDKNLKLLNSSDLVSLEQLLKMESEKNI